MSIYELGRGVELGYTVKQLQLAVRAGLASAAFRFQVRRHYQPLGHATLSSFPLSLFCSFFYAFVHSLSCSLARSFFLTSVLSFFSLRYSAIYLNIPRLVKLRFVFDKSYTQIQHCLTRCKLKSLNSSWAPWLVTNYV